MGLLVIQTSGERQPLHGKAAKGPDQRRKVQVTCSDRPVIDEKLMFDH